MQDKLAPSKRMWHIDGFRGFIMIVMALDHASLYWYQDRIQNEGMDHLFPNTIVPLAFGSRIISHISAPGFFLISGFLLGLKLNKNSESKPHSFYFLRGAELILIDFILINRFDLDWGVLSSLGACTIMITLFHKRPSLIQGLFPLSLVISQVLRDFSPSPVHPALHYLYHILFHASRHSAIAPVLYPVFPWICVSLTGYFLSRLYQNRPRVFFRRNLFLCGLILMTLFLPLKLIFGPLYQEPLLSIVTSKYPPSPAFLSLYLGLCLLIWSAFIKIEERWNPHAWIPNRMAVFGQVPLFFYVLHRWLYGLIPNITETRHQYSFLVTVMIWLTGLVLMYYPCQFYFKLTNSKGVKRTQSDSAISLH